MMAQVISTLCDECLAGGSEVPAVTWGLTIDAPGAKSAPYLIDACEMHAEPYAAVAKTLAEYGRRSDRKAPLPRVAAGPVPAGATDFATTPAGEHVCPVAGCGKSVPTRNGLISHVRRVHEMTLNESLGLVADGAEYPCPDCERHFSTPQGLGRHRTAVHGYRVSARE